MTDSAYYEQLIRGCNILATENAQLRRLMADAEDELAERRGRARLEGKLYAAWQSTILEARRQAARADAAEARLAELEAEDEDEDTGDWMSGMLWARKLTILDVPLVSPAFTGDTTDPWETATEAARQHELVAQRLADYLSADPESHQPVCAHPVSRLGMDPVTSATVCRCGQWITPPAFPRQDQS